MHTKKRSVNSPKNFGQKIFLVIKQNSGYKGTGFIQITFMYNTYKAF